MTWSNRTPFELYVLCCILVNWNSLVGLPEGSITVSDHQQGRVDIEVLTNLLDFVPLEADVWEETSIWIFEFPKYCLLYTSDAADE